MLIDDAGHRPLKRRSSGQHEPKRRAERVEIRTDVDLSLLQLLRTREVRGADKTPHRHRHRLVDRRTERFRQPKIDHLHEQMVLISVEDQHDIGWFDVPMDKFLTVRRDQRARDLPRDPQRKIRRKRPLSLNAAFNSFSLDILHRIKESSIRITKVKNGGDVWMM